MPAGQEFGEEVVVPRPTPTCYPPSNMHIVTWYMSDDLSFATLVKLLTNHSQYQQVRKLELVAPSGEVKEQLVDQLCHYIETNKYLRDVTLFTVKLSAQRASVSNTQERSYLKQIEFACGDNVDCSIQMIPTGEPHLLCDSLTNTIHENVYRRHLAMDGILLQGITKPNLAQLAFDISWDRSIHVCLLKDFPNSTLKALLPKLVHPPLQCLKIVNDPALLGARKLPDAPNFNTLPLQYMLKSPKLKTLQRLYFGHVRFTPSNLPPLLDAIQNHNSTLQELQFSLCHFDAGTGRLFQQFHQDCPHLSIRMDFPVLAPPHHHHHPSNHLHSNHHRGEDESFLMSSMGSVFTVGSTNSLMRGEPQPPHSQPQPQLLHP